MEAVGSLRTFADLSASLESDHHDLLFFRTVKDPTHIRIVDIADKPTDWESIAFEGGCPENEETLGLPKGSYLVLHSPAANSSAFYRVRVYEGKQAESSAFKHGLTMLEQYRLELSKSQEALAKSEAVSATLAEMLEKQREKHRKAKNKLKKAKDGTLERTIETVVNTVMSNPIVATVVANVVGQCVAAGMPQTESPQEGANGFDYEQ